VANFFLNCRKFYNLIIFETEKDLIPLLSPTAVGEFDTPLTKLSGKKDTTLLKLLEAEINESNFFQ
jgi:hypothetical protein